MPLLPYPSPLAHVFRWRTLRWLIAAPVLPLVLWACSAHPLEAPQPFPEQQNDQYYEVNPVREVDILFLVDNSPSMEQEQNNLTRNFPAFMDELKKIPGGLPNVHVGVVSSDLGAGPTPLMGGCGRPAGDRAIFQKKDSCGLETASKFIVSSNNGTMNNFTGDITTVFECMAKLGTAGCGFEHQLQATRVALYEGTTPENKGFLRENAYLAIILITDEDDCSADFTSNLFTDDATYMNTASSFRCAHTGHVCAGMQPPIAPFMMPLENCQPATNTRLIKVQDFVDSIKALKKRPEQQILVSGIFGWPLNTTGALYRYAVGDQGLDFSPICESPGNGRANAGLRLKAFVESFGTSGSFFSICEDDFRPAMKQIGEKLAAKLGNPCITAPVVDTKLDMPGVQPDCQVVDRVPMGAGYMDQPLPFCGSGKTPCWRLTNDAACTDSGFKIDVDRGGMLALPGTQQSIKCLTCARAGDARCARM
jgi:hypothetical protein